MSVQEEVIVWAVNPFMAMVFHYIEVAGENQRIIPLALLPYISLVPSLL